MRVKTKQEIGRKLAQRYKNIWAREIVSHDEDAWPYAVNIGEPSKRELEQSFAAIESELGKLSRWAQDQGLTCRFKQRLVGRVSYKMLTHIEADGIDCLAHATHNERHLQTYCERLEQIRREFPHLSDDDVRSVLTTMNRIDADDVDFDLICRAGKWFSEHDACGYTAREVPLEGFHAKWLDLASHRQIVMLLCGKDELGLKERPRLVRYRYLDPVYLKRGLRIHDSWVEGDSNVPAYVPHAVIICENRDSALWFPQVEGGICVLGDGKAGISTLVQIDWISGAEHLFYWGDMDIEGFEILAKYREAGLRPKSILMDTKSYEMFRRFGASTDAHGRALVGKDADALPWLTEEENELYLQLCTPSYAGPRRVEQERIPLALAQAKICAAIGG